MERYVRRAYYHMEIPIMQLIFHKRRSYLIKSLN